MAGDFARLKVVPETPVGAFLDWGLPKDLLVPFREQNTPMKKGCPYIVRVYLDERSQRVVASCKTRPLSVRYRARPHAGQEVELFVCTQTALGRKVIINRAHWGLLHSSDIFQPLHSGQRLTGFVKTVRTDGKLMSACTSRDMQKSAISARPFWTLWNNTAGRFPSPTGVRPSLSGSGSG